MPIYRCNKCGFVSEDSQTTVNTQTPCGRCGNPSTVYGTVYFVEELIRRLASASRELDGLEHNLEFLASVGSISPYVGLFGTVWGIMVSFQGLANVKEATIATVAPGISEALVATAMGLFAAIPAVWAYNRFATKVDRISTRYDAFSEEFSSILQRQANVEE